jgi:hypothetical protein
MPDTFELKFFDVEREFRDTPLGVIVYRLSRLIFFE